MLDMIVYQDTLFSICNNDSHFMITYSRDFLLTCVAEHPAHLPDTSFKCDLNYALQ